MLGNFCPKTENDEVETWEVNPESGRHEENPPLNHIQFSESSQKIPKLSGNKPNSIRITT